MGSKYFKYKPIDEEKWERMEEQIGGRLYISTLHQLNDKVETFFEAVDVEILKHLAKNYGVDGADGEFVKLASDLNVDMAFLAALFKPEELRKIINEQHIEPFKNCARVQCLTTRSDSILMWTHYAKEFNGVVVEYDHEDLILSIEEMKKRNDIMSIVGPQEVTYDDDRIFPMKGISENAMINFMMTKFSDWAYEKEQRIIFIFKKETDQKFYMPLKPKRVICGFNVSEKNLERIERFCQENRVAFERLSKVGAIELMRKEAANRSIKKLARLR